jgi:ribonuclease BN (tRNA processing enzyme)
MEYGTMETTLTTPVRRKEGETRKTMKVTFLGTNGWYSTETGNTPCVLVETDGYYLIFDAGDGIHKLDNYIDSDKPIYLFLSHFHLEHIEGLHILNKFRFPQGIRIYGQNGTRRILQQIVQHPFTCPLNNLPIKLSIKELSEGKHRIPFAVTCRQLVHSDPCLGYRVELDGKTIAYCTDTGICENSLLLAKNADILIHDCAENLKQRTPQWPHAISAEAAKLAKNANVKQLVLFHFSAAIYKSREERKEAEEDAKAIFEKTVASQDGMQLTI